MAKFLLKLITIMVQMIDILPALQPQGNIPLKLNPDHDGNCMYSVPLGMDLIC